MALLLGNTAALLLGLLAALLSGHVAALLGVVNLLTHLPGHLLADLSVHSLTLLVVGSGALLRLDVLDRQKSCQISDKVDLIFYLALLSRDLVAFPLVDHAAVLCWNILADLVLDSLALPLIDHLALGLGTGGALLLHNGGALLLVPDIALLVILGGALLLVDSLLNSSGDADALHLRDAVTLLLELLMTLLLNVVGGVAILLVIQRALLPGDSLLDRFLGNLALALLDIRAQGIGHIATLPPGHSLVGCLRHLLAHLLGHLAAHGLGHLLVRVVG